MHDVRKVDIVGVDADADLFFGLADERGNHGFVGFQVAGRQMRASILKARVLPLAEEHLIAAAQNQVNITG